MQTIVNNPEALSRGTNNSLNESFHPEKNKDTYTSNSPRSSATLPAGGLKTPTAESTSTSGRAWMSFLGKQSVKRTPSTTTSTQLSQSNPDFDITYITSKLTVISKRHGNASDEPSHQTIAAACDMLDKKYGQSFMLYSLDQPSTAQSSFQNNPLHNRTLELPVLYEGQSQNLINLLYFCQKITSYLLQSPSNVAALFCSVSKNQLAFGTCSLLAYHQLFPRVDQIIQYYESHRCAHALLTMSQKRYIQYLCDLSSGVIERPHFNELTIKSITLTPVPLVNRQKNGCQPFVDIYDQNNKKIFSTFEDASKLRSYSAIDAYCSIRIDFPFKDDLTIHISHASTDQSRRTGGNGVRICELTINPNFSRLNQPELTYSRNELDGIDQNEKSPTLFRVTMDISHSPKTATEAQDTFLKQLNNTLKQPLALFRDDNELQKKMNDFAKPVRTDSPSTFSSAFFFPLKSKDSTASLDASNSSSPRNSFQLSGSYPTTPLSPVQSNNLLSPSSFTNPFHNTFSQRKGIQTSSPGNISPTPPSTNQTPIKEETVVAPLVGLIDDDSTNISFFERSLSLDPKQNDFNSSCGSQTNLLDDDFESVQNITSTKLPDIILPTLVNNTKQSSPTTTDSSTQSKLSTGPNYNVSIPPQTATSTPLPSHPTKQNPPPSYMKTKSTDLDKFFGGLDGLKPDPKLKVEPTPPGAIGVILRASLAQDVDPIVLRVREWTEGKKRNLRALLCSLSNVIWPECKWAGCQMSDLLSYEQVKKMYKKAVIHIHPDKLRGDPNEQLAKLIFVELNEAWSEFERQSK